MLSAWAQAARGVGLQRPVPLLPLVLAVAVAVADTQQSILR
jgi:hypothetical protein